MKTNQRLFLLIILLLLVGIMFGQNVSFADPIESDTGTFLKMPTSAETDSGENNNSGAIIRESAHTLQSPEDHPHSEFRNKVGTQLIAPPVDRTLTNILAPNAVQRQHINAPAEEVCWQLLGNSAMDIFPIDDNTATVEPWVPLVQQVYYDDTFYTSAPTSLALWIDDDGATDFSFLFVEDAFAQAFYMPDALTAVYIEYNTSIDNIYDIDEVYGEIWIVDSEGFLVESVGWWRIDEPTPPSPPDWEQQFILVEDAGFLNAMQNNVLAIIFDNYTDPDLLGEGEIVWFDDAQIIACADVPESDGLAYMPIIMKNVAGASSPICLPPTETPQDSFTQNRGTVQTNALCETTLSSVDRQDYYSFRTGPAGNYRLSLTNLPTNTEWSGAILVENPPAYAPGPSNNECRITTPGAVDKQVTCNLAANKEYIIKVSAGDYDGAKGSYKMRITKP